MAYPYLEDAVQDLTGFDVWLPLPTFGFMVACAIFTAIWLTGREVTRLVNEGKLGMAWRKKPDGEIEELHPKELVGNLGAIAALVGLVGARLFHIFEYMDEFWADPIGMAFARGGMTIYGGLIFGVIAGVWYVRRWNLPVLRMADASAPSIMLAYGIGRLGCQFSGDGDWGIMANMALKPDWLPKWLWAQTYPGNVLGRTIPEPGVYPTPLYESVMAFALFAVLWRFRKHPYLPGWLFSLYLVLNGAQRWLIEQIRVNVVLDFMVTTATQAEVIAVFFGFAGISGMILFSMQRTEPAPEGAS